MDVPKNTRIVLLVAVASTLAMMVLGSFLSGQQNLSSSLLSTGSGAVLDKVLSYDPVLREFPVAVEESTTRSKELALRTGSGAGLYFPHLYQANMMETGAVLLAYMSPTPLAIEASLELTLEYPERFVQYLGAGSRDLADGSRLVSGPKGQENTLTVRVENTTGLPLLLPTAGTELISLPFQLNLAQPGQVLNMRIRDVRMEMFDGTYRVLPFDTSVIPVFAVPTIEGIVPKRVALTSEVVRTEVPVRTSPTQSVSQPAQVTQVPQAETDTSSSVIPTAPLENTSDVISSPSAPVILPGTSRFSPARVVRGQGETIFFYTTVSSPDVPLTYAVLDARALGVMTPLALNAFQSAPGEYQLSTSFQFSGNLSFPEPTVDLLLSVRNEAGLSTSVFLALPIDNPSTSTNSTGTGSTVELDINGDGNVTIEDLNIFLDAYRRATSTL